MNLLVRMLCVGCLAVVIGCGEGATEVPVDTGISVSQLIKRDLEMVAQNGQMGSEMMSIENNLEKLKVEDPAKAEAFRKDLDELAKLSGARAKSKAEAMIGKL